MYYYIYYYDVDGNKILKYEVGFDLQKVRELQVNLVRDCGDERHYVYITHEIPLKSKDLIYMKFECKKIDGNNYRVEIIANSKPYLYDVIDRIIAGDGNAIVDLFMYKVDTLEDENTRDINYYYYTLQRMFKMRLVETLDVSIYNKVREFVGEDAIKCNDLKLVLNKKNN